MESLCDCQEPEVLGEDQQTYLNDVGKHELGEILQHGAAGSGRLRGSCHILGSSSPAEHHKLVEHRVRSNPVNKNPMALCVSLPVITIFISSVKEIGKK